MVASKTISKSVAAFEAAKGTIVLLGGFGILSLVHRDVRLIAAALVGRLHLNPAHRFASSFIAAANQTTDARLWFYASAGFLYALFRYIEAYGLWQGRSWAVWLAVVSGGAFLPFELVAMVEKLTWIRVSAFLVNLLVVSGLAGVILKMKKSEPVRPASP